MADRTRVKKQEEIKERLLLLFDLMIKSVDRNDGRLPFIECHLSAGKIKLEDGRMAQVQITITTDKSRFLSGEDLANI